MRPQSVNNTDETTLVTRMRRQRFAVLQRMLDELPGTISVLDIGGTPGYWHMMTSGTPLSDRLRLTIVNPEPEPSSQANVTVLAGDGRSLPQFADKQFDVVFSNSTIEHVGTFEDQRRMAAEMRRLGHRYYLQTPNRYFPIEPHFLFPYFQLLPVSLRIWLVSHFSLGWYPVIRDPERARHEVTVIRLMTKDEVRALFPEATVFEEKFYGLVKSFVAYTAHAI